MKFGKYDIKKRYIIGGLLAVWLLSKCTGGEDKLEQANLAPQPTPAPQQYDDQREPEQQQYVQQQPAAGAPVTIVNTPAQSGGDHGFLTGLMMGHIFGNNNGGGGGRYERSYSNNSTRRTVINKTVNNYHAPAPAPVATAPRKYGPTTAYNTQPAPQPKYRTWSTSTKKGWGSSTSYKQSKPSYSYSSKGSFSRSSSYSRRR